MDQEKKDKIEELMPVHKTLHDSTNEAKTKDYEPKMQDTNNKMLGK